jgi:hypothetical protein
MVITVKFILNFPIYNVLLTSAYVVNNGIYLLACLGSSIFSVTNLQSLPSVLDVDLCKKFYAQEGLSHQS